MSLHLMCGTLLSDHDSALPNAGIKLLDLPQEVLHAIFSHFKAHEWAQGPAQSCRLLSGMDLPRVALHLPVRHQLRICMHVCMPLFKVPKLPVRTLSLCRASIDSGLTGTLCAQIKRSLHGITRCLAGLTWAAKRMGPSTHWLDVCLSPCESKADEELIAAFGSVQHRGQVLCLQADLSTAFSSDGFAREFLVWLLKSVPNLVALNLGSTLCPPPNTFSFTSLRHLQLMGDRLQCTFQPAQQLPVLQTLCISGLVSELHEVNLLGCRQLSKLAMDACSTQRLLLEPACHFSADLLEYSRVEERVWRAPFEVFQGSVCELNLCCREGCMNSIYLNSDGKGVFTGLPRLAVLKVAWPEELDVSDAPHKTRFVHGAEGLLTNCLASDGPPVLGLRVIIITAFAMQARIPGNLPNLEQLVIFSEGHAELSFEDPVGTILGLKSFYAFGQPLEPNGMDLVRMMNALATRSKDRALGAAVAQTAGKGFDGGSSCVYLRPAAADALPMQRLHNLVAALAQGCRCGACFDCLSKAGRLDF